MTCTMIDDRVDQQYTGDVNAFSIVTLGGDQDLATATSFKGFIAKGVGYHRVNEELTVTLINAASRTVKVEYGDATGWLATAAVGQWELQIEVAWADGTSLTWPKPRNPALLVDVLPSTE